MSKPRVAVCLLTGTERTHWPCPELAQVLFHIAKDQRFDVELCTIKARPFETARNHALVGARDHGFDWCVQLDNDNFTRGFTPLDIIATAGPEHNVIGLTYGVPKDNGFILCPSKNAPSTGFREVDAVAGGVLMVHRSVWQKIPRGPWFRWQHGDNETLDQGQNGCGEDVYFCRLCRENGLQVWTHSQLAGHWKTCDATAMSYIQSQTVPVAIRPTAPPNAPPSPWITMQR